MKVYVVREGEYCEQSRILGVYRASSEAMGRVIAFWEESRAPHPYEYDFERSVDGKSVWRSGWDEVWFEVHEMAEGAQS